jgi:hypothetical protein
VAHTIRRVSSRSTSADARCAGTRNLRTMESPPIVLDCAVRASCPRYPTRYTLPSSTSLKTCVGLFSSEQNDWDADFYCISDDCGRRCMKVWPQKRSYRNDGEGMQSMRCVAVSHPIFPPITPPCPVDREISNSMMGCRTPSRGVKVCMRLRHRWIVLSISLLVLPY